MIAIHVCLVVMKFDKKVNRFIGVIIYIKEFAKSISDTSGDCINCLLMKRVIIGDKIKGISQYRNGSKCSGGFVIIWYTQGDHECIVRGFTITSRGLNPWLKMMSKGTN